MPYIHIITACTIDMPLNSSGSLFRLTHQIISCDLKRLALKIAFDFPYYENIHSFLIFECEMLRYRESFIPISR